MSRGREKRSAMELLFAEAEGIESEVGAQPAGLSVKVGGNATVGQIIHGTAILNYSMSAPPRLRPGLEAPSGDLSLDELALLRAWREADEEARAALRAWVRRGAIKRNDASSD